MHINLHGLFNANTILVEWQLWYYSTHIQRGDKGFWYLSNFPPGWIWYKIILSWGGGRHAQKMLDPVGIPHSWGASGAKRWAKPCHPGIAWRGRPQETRRLARWHLPGANAWWTPENKGLVSGEDKRIYSFPKCISPKLIVIARLEFKLRC